MYARAFQQARRYSAHSSPKDVAQWKKLSMVGVGLVICSHILLFGDHGHGDRADYSHLAILSKPFPWKDGKTPLFASASHHDH